MRRDLDGGTDPINRIAARAPDWPNEDRSSEVSPDEDRSSASVPAGETRALLHYWNDSWPLHADKCPCDVDFVDFLEEQAVADATIFHFGTGAHHHVGLRLAGNGGNNAVLGVTAAPREYEAYIRLAIERPEISRRYKVEFGDIYLTEPRLLPPGARRNRAAGRHLQEPVAVSPGG